MLNPHTLYNMALDVHAQNISCMQTNLICIRCQLDSTGLATTTYLHLGLYNNWVHSLLGFSNCFFNSVCNTAC